MSLQKGQLGSKQKGLINYLKDKKNQTLIKEIAKLGVITFLTLNIPRFVVNPYEYYELFTNQVEKQIVSEDDYNIVSSFCDKFNQLPEKWQENFNNKFNQLKIYNVPIDFFFIFRDAVGYYNGDGRIVTKSNVEQRTKTIEHELMHMSSDSGKNIGLHFDKNNYGRGINEGYTNHLVCSLFDHKSTVYITQTQCAQIFDSIIGTEKMMDYYFTSNGDGLVNEISSIYQNADNIIYGKYNEKECKKRTIDLMKLIDKTISEDNESKLMKLRWEIADELYKLAIYSRLDIDNVYLTDDLDSYYLVHLNIETIKCLGKLNPNKWYCVGEDYEFNFNHPITIKTTLSHFPLKTPNEIVEKYNENKHIK